MQSIDGYVETLRTVKGDRPAGKDEKRKTAKALMLMSEILTESGHEEPDATDRAEYRRRSRQSEAAIRQDMSRIDRYFALQTERRVQRVMIEPEPVGATRAGRKCLDAVNGEKRTEKLMLYLTPTMIADIRDWCSLKRISCVSYITGLIGEDMASKQDKLKEYRLLSDEA